MRFKLAVLAATAMSFACAQKPVAVSAAGSSGGVGVGPQYDSTHVYVAPENLEAFVKSFLGTFGGTSTKPVVLNVLPTPSSTTSELLHTPVGTVSLFGYQTPIPAPFGVERTGYLVKDMDAAVRAARAAGADVFVTPFTDPIGRDALIQFPGGVNTQIYWHTTPPSYEPFLHVPDNRVYVSADRADAFIQSFLQFSGGKVVSDVRRAPGIEIGRPTETYRRVRIESVFGKVTALVTDGHLPYPYGRETTGYGVDNLDDTLDRAQKLGVVVLVKPYRSDGVTAALVEFPGGYIAEIHNAKPS